MVPAMNMAEILGPIVLAVVINSTLYGTCVVQWYNYHTAGYNDPLFTRLLVYWCMILDTTHTAVTVYLLWDFTVGHFGDYSIYQSLPWTYSTTPIWIVSVRFEVASVPIQHFLAWRIKNLSHRWIWFFICSALSLGQGTCAFVGGVLASTTARSNLESLIPVAESWISLAVLTDVFIALLLLYYLHKGKTGYQTSVDHVIGRLIITVIETCSVGAIVCIVDIIIFTTNPRTNLHFLFALPQGRIYTNTLMVTLNARASLREEMRTTRFNGVELPGNMSRLKASEFSIGIPHTEPGEIEIDQFSLTSSGRESREKDAISIA
ncbi:hypothetical protein BJ322DRAFT_1105666 [Thelephora terrestris]|uniref:DUF6534 domain-containing protein n=1 Tax=Thelephora terrestris TaxID=56493 RepID=A0A9P6HL78_9AGAM|nr:hypothetical protein BJ322DRAFT_1105666 [Thelephora terrestris]